MLGLVLGLGSGSGYIHSPHSELWFLAARSRAQVIHPKLLVLGVAVGHTLLEDELTLKSQVVSVHHCLVLMCGDLLNGGL